MGKRAPAGPVSERGLRALSQYKFTAAGYTWCDRLHDPSGSHLVRAFQALPEQVYRKAGYATQRVQVRSLDQLAAEHDWRDVQLMKIDVEGAEHLLLRGAQVLLQRDKPLLLLEVHGAASLVLNLSRCRQHLLVWPLLAILLLGLKTRLLTRRRGMFSELHFR